MKKLLLTLFIFGALFLNTISAKELQCHTVEFNCLDGSGGYGLVCGETEEEYTAEYIAMYIVICGSPLEE
jgi:hypothetical protein